LLHLKPKKKTSTGSELIEAGLENSLQIL